MTKHEQTGTHTPVDKNKHPATSLARRAVYGVGFVAWVVTTFMLAQLLIVAAVWLFAQLKISLPFVLTDTVLQTIVSVFVYILAIGLAIGIPWKLLRHRLAWKDVGLEQSLPRWRDIGLAPVALGASVIITGIVIYIVSLAAPGVDLETQQQVGFENLTQRYEMLLAFFTLVILAPICEELLFRGYLYGRVRKYYSAFWTVVVISFAFGMMHLYAGPGLPLQWNVVINTTVLALCIGAVRAYTGSIWAGILVHMIKNGIAFFVLFVAPLLGLTLVQ